MSEATTTPFLLQDATIRFNLKSAQLTVSNASLILASIGLVDDDWNNISERDMLMDACKASVAATNGILPMVPICDPPRADPRPHECNNNNNDEDAANVRDLIIHSDYEILKEITIHNQLTTLPNLKFTKDASVATMWFYIANQTSFLSIPPTIHINQFPFEGGFVRKDLLPLTIRRHAYGRPGLGSTAPSWWLPCFDLSTEFHLFTDLFDTIIAETNNSLDNRWVVKMAQGTRSQGSKVISTLKDAADFISTNKNSSTDYVVQKLVNHPLTVGGRKFDMRVWIFVRSFSPDTFEAYMSTFFVARVSNKQYNDGDLSDDEVFLTVSAYNDEIEDGVRMTPNVLKEWLLRDDPNFDFDGMVNGIKVLASELFRSLAPSVGDWPRSRAYYGIDVIIDADGSSSLLEKNYDSAQESQRQARLLEINFAGDMNSVKAGAESNGEEDKFLLWGDDLANVLFTDVDVSKNHRLIGL